MTIVNWVEVADLENASSPLAASAVRLASRVLFSLTGRIYGGEKTVTEVYYPRSQELGNSLRTLTLQRYGIGTSCTPFPYRLEATGDVRIPLRCRPVRAVESLQVVTTGEFVGLDDYWVSDSAYLTVSPRVPVLSGLSVQYTYGTNPPEDGRDAARALADEFVILFGGGPDAECRLKNVTNFSRQGVSFTVEDAATILADGRTGVPEVDMFVESVNPSRRSRHGATANRAQLRSKVLSPDAHIPWR